MNRRGRIFTFALLIAYFLSAVSALIGLSLLLTQRLPSEGIGAYQEAMLSTYDRAEAKLYYLERATGMAVEDAARELRENQRQFFSFDEGEGSATPECGTYLYQLWNDGNQCLLDGDLRERVAESLPSRALSRLGDTLGAYPGGLSVPYTVTLGEHDVVSFTIPSDRYLEEPIIVNLAPEQASGSRSASREIDTVLTGKNKVDGLLWPSSIAPTISSCFGPREIAQGRSNKHMGLDIVNGGSPVPVRAALAGTVINVPPGSSGTIWIQHSDTLSTRYMHLLPGTITVRLGDFVQQGQHLGMAADFDCPGCGYHLHFEALVSQLPASAHAYQPQGLSGWQAVNPLCLFPEENVLLPKGLGTESCELQRHWRTSYCDEYGLIIQPRAEESIPAPQEQLPDTGPVQLTQEGGSVTLTSEQMRKLSATKARLESQDLLPVIEEAGATAGVDSALLLGVITQESGGDPLAISTTSCAGIAQFCIDNEDKYKSTAAKMFNGGEKLTFCGCRSSSGQVMRATPGAIDPYGKKCACNAENDARLRPEEAIPAAAKLLRSNLDYNAFVGKRDGVKFAVAAYNGGTGPIRSAIKVSGSSDPSWEEVASILRKHPEYITYGPESGREAKVDEIIDYVERVMVYAAAWNGGAEIAVVPARAIEEVQERYGDVKRLGVYRFKPDMTVRDVDVLSSFLATGEWIRSTAAHCAREPVPATCLEEAMAEDAVTDVCEDDPAVEYLADLYEALRDCAENRQESCACRLPHPPAGDVWHSLLLINEEEGMILAVDEPVDGLWIEQLELKVEQEPKLFDLFSDTAVFEPQGVRIRYQGDQVRLFYTRDWEGWREWGPGWVAEKEGGLVLREEKRSQELCAPVKKRYALCNDAGVKFSMVLEDETLPLAEAFFQPITRWVTVEGSEDVSFYRIEDEQGELLMELRGTAFDAEQYAGLTLRIIPIDQTGNVGEAALLDVPPPLGVG